MKWEESLRSGVDKGYRQIMQFCSIYYSTEDASLVIDCPTFDDADVLQHIYSRQLCSKIEQLRLANVLKIKAAGKSLYSYPPKFFLKKTQKMSRIHFTAKRLVSTADKELRERVDECGYPTTVILMPDNFGGKGHKGLYANNGITEVCGLELNDWIGKDMCQGWSIPELQKFMSYLKGDSPGRRLTEYVYSAWKLTGEPIELCVNADLGYYQTSLVRIVSVLGMRLL